MDKTILKGRYPDLFGYLVLVEHSIPAEEIWTQLHFWSEQYLSCGSHRTERFHEIIDEKIEQQLELDKQAGYHLPFCHKGCSNCCYQPVLCTHEEAQLVSAYCAEHRIPIDYETLSKQLTVLDAASGNEGGSLPTWDEQAEAEQACVFLDREEGICRIWKVRPYVCRVHLAEKTNEHCRSRGGVPNPLARGIHYPVCSYILSSIFSIHHDSIGKTMGRLLLEQHLASSGANPGP